MQTNKFHQSIQLALPSITSSEVGPFAELASRKNGYEAYPPEVYAGEVIAILEKHSNNISTASAESLFSEEELRAGSQWAKENPRDCMLAFIAYEMNNLKDYDISIPGFLERIEGSLETCEVTSLAKNYNISIDLVRLIDNSLQAEQAKNDIGIKA